MKKEEVIRLLGEVRHPGRDDKSLLELGMVESVDVQDGKVSVVLAFPKHRDPLAEYLIGSARAVIYRNAPAGTEIEVKTIVK